MYIYIYIYIYNHIYIYFDWLTRHHHVAPKHASAFTTMAHKSHATAHPLMDTSRRDMMSHENGKALMHLTGMDKLRKFHIPRTSNFVFPVQGA